MADQPHPPSFYDDLTIHSLSEVAIMKEKFLQDFMANKIRLAKREERLKNPSLEGGNEAGRKASIVEDEAVSSAPEERLGDEEDIDPEEEYRKEMEDQRVTDRKNGHFSQSSDGEEVLLKSTNRRTSGPDSSPPTTGLPTVPSTKGLARTATPISRKQQKKMEKMAKSSSATKLHATDLTHRSSARVAHRVAALEADTSLPVAPREHQKKHPESPSSTHAQTSARASRRSTRVSQRVDAYESSLSPRVSVGGSGIFAEHESRKRDSMVVVSSNTNRILHGDFGASSFDLVNTENSGRCAVRCGEGVVPNSLIAAKNPQFLEGCDMQDVICINEATKIGVNAFIDSKCFEEAAEIGGKAFSAINCFDEDMGVNALIVETKQPLSHLNCKINTHSGGVGSLEECVHVIGCGDESQGMLPNIPQSLPSGPPVLNVAPLTAYHHEDHAHLDLLETRSHVAQQADFMQPYKPLSLEPGFSNQTPNEAQVSPLLNPNNSLPFPLTNFPPGTFFMNPSQFNLNSQAQKCQPISSAHKPQPISPQPISPQPTTTSASPLIICQSKEPNQKSFDISRQPNPSAQINLSSNFSQPKPNSNVHLNHPKLSAQTKYSSFFPQPNPISIGKDKAAILCVDRNSLQTFSTSMFPPLPSATPIPTASISIGNGTPNVTAASSAPLPPPLHTANPPNGHLNASSKSWADFVDHGQNLHENIAKNPSHVQPSSSAKPADGQPQIFFGRSMADVLKTGQPADGPILLDHDRATKRGEVRIVEGKPCLFFSANETSILAGRIGPAIVGKFSHSIPTAHQIQKALGNLKLFGAMSWNFLNAKHVFIQLSDMRDYVKLLNGPNNSPVWYVEHHPMRVFKWTPDFDPFFEIPVVAIWCNILALPVHLFEESALIAIGDMLGHAVQVDRATISRSRVSFARICVEVDISRPIAEEIDLDIAGKRVTLKVKWDKIPMYCNECRHVGHTARNCYAFGKRAMPPKKDYSFGGTSQNRATPQGEGAPSHWGRSNHARPDAGRQEMGPQARPRAGPDSVRPHTEHGPKAPGSPFHAGPSGTATAGTPADVDDGFLMPKKKKKNTRSVARMARHRERQRQKKQQLSTPAEADSEGGGDHGTDSQDSASVSDSRAGSLSPSYRPRHVCDSLAIVAVDNNMFGALEDFPSENEEEQHHPRPQDTWMVEASASRTRMLELEDRGKGHTSPPPEGRLKKAKLGASGPH